MDPKKVRSKFFSVNTSGSRRPGQRKRPLQFEVFPAAPISANYFLMPDREVINEL
jgi:hypothetical protein